MSVKENIPRDQSRHRAVEKYNIDRVDAWVFSPAPLWEKPQCHMVFSTQKGDSWR